ncbi:hypothetical protein BXZ70DRAFT_144182 [Cristinia sonorae]|uniref:Uncharacterized protein n=1 Tax=Cristinia sonorae TaxID=1940300 RepID=A0A8K0XQ81_9AGAR|nr:hypothetical protein BXZ70DRAFT_144182 [Cristinia sonorae]
MIRREEQSQTLSPRVQMLMLTKVLGLLGFVHCQEVMYSSHPQTLTDAEVQVIASATLHVAPPYPCTVRLDDLSGAIRSYAQKRCPCRLSLLIVVAVS